MYLMASMCIFFIDFSDVCHGYVSTMEFFQAVCVDGSSDSCSDYFEGVDDPSLCTDFIDQWIVFVCSGLAGLGGVSIMGKCEFKYLYGEVRFGHVCFVVAPCIYMMCRRNLARHAQFEVLHVHHVIHGGIVLP